VERMKENDASNATSQMTSRDAGNLDLSGRPISF
jgi:hypothetical protein